MDYSSIWEGKSIWDAESSDWVSSLLSQAEEEAQQMEEEEAQVEDEDEMFMDDLMQEESRERPMSSRQMESLDGLYPSSSNGGSFSGIYKNEGARTGQPTNLKSTAVGRGQMIKGTRIAMYKKAGISDIESAEQEYRTNPQFEETINNLYREELDSRIPENIQGKQREYMIAKGWYTGNPFYKDDVVPHPEAGNKMTAGEYARRATMKQYGGKEEFLTQAETNRKMFGISKAQYGEEDDKYGIPIMSDLEWSMRNSGLYSGMSPNQLDEVEIRGKRNNSQQEEAVDIFSPIRDIFGEITDEQSKLDDKKFLSNIPSDLYGMYQDVRTFAKDKVNTAVDAINIGLDTTISYLGDRQNKQNISKANKLLSDERYSSIQNSKNKKRAYI